MSKTNSHNGENWPYHPYEGANPKLQGSYVPCATNPCTLHGGSDVMGTSPENAYENAHKNDSWGFTSSVSAINNDSNDEPSVDYGGYTVSVNDLIKSLVKNDDNMNSLLDMAHDVSIYIDADKYSFSNYVYFEGIDKSREIAEYEPYTPLFHDEDGYSVDYGEVDWNGDSFKDDEYHGFTIMNIKDLDSFEKEPNPVLAWDGFGNLELKTLEEIKNEAWEQRADIINDYNDNFTDATDKINTLDVIKNKSFIPSPNKTMASVHKSRLRAISDLLGKQKDKKNKGIHNYELIPNYYDCNGLNVTDINHNDHKYYFSINTDGDITGFGNELGKPPTHKFDKPVKSDDSEIIMNAIFDDIQKNL